MANLDNRKRSPLAFGWQLWAIVSAGVALAAIYGIAIHLLAR